MQDACVTMACICLCVCIYVAKQDHAACWLLCMPAAISSAPMLSASTCSADKLLLISIKLMGQVLEIFDCYAYTIIALHLANPRYSQL